MVSLPLMARLLDAVRPEATVVLVGDPFQLASVEAGAVLGDIVGTASTRTEAAPLAADVVLLERVHRFQADSAIAALADAIRDGDADQALELLANDPTGELTWVDENDEAGIATLKAEVADQFGRSDQGRPIRRQRGRARTRLRPQGSVRHPTRPTRRLPMDR